jgi:hypothetical protein
MTGTCYGCAAWTRLEFGSGGYNSGACADRGGAPAPADHRCGGRGRDAARAVRLMRPNQIAIEREAVPRPDGTTAHDVVLRIRCVSREHAEALRRQIAEMAEEGEVRLPFFLAHPAPIDGDAAEARTIEGPR